MSAKFVLPERVRSELFSYLLREFGFNEVEFSVEHGSKNGDSYSSDIYRVVLDGGDKVRNGSTTNPIPHQFILKMSPTVEVRRQMFNTTHQFFQEYYMYSVVLPAFETFQAQYLDEKDIFRNYPKMISGSLEPGQEYILLEDMCALGYSNFHRPTPLNFEQCVAVFKNLAKLHAVSFAYKDQRPNDFQRLVNPLKENVFKTPVEEGFATFMTQKVDCAVQIIEEADRTVKDRVLQFRDILVESMVECVNEKTHAVVVHGDCWVSNLLYTQKDPKSDIDITFIDWQITRHATPIVDLAYFTFCCTDSSLRARLKELLEIYYITIAERITSLKSDPDKLFSYTTFQNHVQKYMKFGFGMALMSLHAITLDPNEMPDVVPYLDNADFEKFNEITVELTKREAYKERMIGVCKDLVANGYI